MRVPVSLALLAAGVVLAGCAVQPPGGAVTPPASPPVQAPASPTPEPPPPPTPEPTDLVKGANHNELATEYAYPAKDVHTWLVEKDKAANYPTKKIAFLTFDDGPNNDTTPVILDILKEKQTPATFFIIGGKVGIGTADPAVVKRTIHEGHAIAIHTFTHNYRELYPGRKGKPSAVLADHDKALKAVQSILGPDFNTAAYRYPGGHMSWKAMEASDKALADKGIYWIDWNTLNGDAEPASRAPTSVEGAQSMVMRHLGQPPANVAVVLMHDTGGRHAMTVKALPGIIDQLKDAGYEFGIIA